MKVYEHHELVFGAGTQKIFYERLWADFMFILLHVVHKFDYAKKNLVLSMQIWAETIYFMNYMKVYEVGEFNGFFCDLVPSAMDFMNMAKGRTSQSFIFPHPAIYRGERGRGTGE